jgi:DNA invertase Pin-like site-specific DNA recombinase
MGLPTHCRITEDCLSIENSKVIAMTEQLRRIGYLRTSPTDRNRDGQAEALKQVWCTKIYEAVTPPRALTELQQLLNLLGGGDELIVYCLDRLACNEHSLINLQQQLQAMRVGLIVTSNAGTSRSDYAD